MPITTLCDVYCCIKTLNDNYVAAECSNPRLADELLAKLDKVISLVALYDIATGCGNTTAATAHLQEISTLTNCTEECGCS